MLGTSEANEFAQANDENIRVDGVFISTTALD